MLAKIQFQQPEMLATQIMVTNNFLQMSAKFQAPEMVDY